MATPEGLRTINLTRKDKENVHRGLHLLAEQAGMKRQRKLDTINRLTKDCEQLKKDADGFQELADKFFVMPLPDGVAEV